MKPGRRERKHHGESPKVVSTGLDPRSSRANHDCTGDGQGGGASSRR
nr:MAG TPA: hypothetical protein [Caudoviricetes sp.]